MMPLPCRRLREWFYWLLSGDWLFDLGRYTARARERKWLYGSLFHNGNRGIKAAGKLSLHAWRRCSARRRKPTEDSRTMSSGPDGERRKGLRPRSRSGWARACLRYSSRQLTRQHWRGICAGWVLAWRWYCCGERPSALLERLTLSARRSCCSIVFIYKFVRWRLMIFRARYSLPVVFGKIRSTQIRA